LQSSGRVTSARIAALTLTPSERALGRRHPSDVSPMTDEKEFAALTPSMMAQDRRHVKATKIASPQGGSRSKLEIAMTTGTPPELEAA